MRNVICILVLYNPSKNVIKNAIKSIINQIDFLWISDNTPGGYDINIIIEECWKEKVHYQKMDNNVGIAKAQNYGINYAIKNKYKEIFFLDQDSISPNGIVLTLEKYIERLEDIGVKVGGVGPLIINRESGCAYKIRGFSVLGKVKEVRELTSSGSLIKTSLFEEIGLMDTALFIDAVDFEMCWRACFYGSYHFFIVLDISLSHKIGEGDRRFFGKKFEISTPFRSYYQYRNLLFLIRRKYVPLSWKLRNIARCFVSYFCLPLFVKPRFEYLMKINKGIFDGLFRIIR